MRVPPLNSRIDDRRSEATRYEASLEPGRRKRLGQFFSGLPLGRVLAVISLGNDASSVIDPMAGHADLLDAVIERAALRGQRLALVEGVEIDVKTAEVCRERLAGWEGSGVADAIAIRGHDAFDDKRANEYAGAGYDLVITNPPYVRYQSLTNGGNGDEAVRSGEEIRRSLRRVAESRIDRAEWPVWRTLIDSYSGLADLSVPAWILAAALVRPGGVLALVAPATWRSRNYGDIIQYLLARCFRLEWLVEDTQPGWFSNALVRTQLVIARRRTSDEVRTRLLDRTGDPSTTVLVKVSPSASSGGSLVGAAFPSDDPEGRFSEWLRGITRSGEDQAHGLTWTVSHLQDVWDGAFASARERSWYQALEPSRSAGPLFEQAEHTAPSIIPAALRPLLDDLQAIDATLPEEAGVSISQGLRTGCNGFFYVDLVAQVTPDGARVRLSQLFESEEIEVPTSCLVTVVRRQAEVHGPVDRSRLTGRVLDLSVWVLPEDTDVVERARHLYAREGLPVPSVMPPALAEFVRRAAQTSYGTESQHSRIPELSAVRTNSRSAEAGRAPRFWYMLPPFARRHYPDAFVARINQGVPWVEINDDPPALIDANFSTIWAENAGWTRFAIRSLLNSSWCRACMEALGTPLGGGALKLEATQIRRLPIPLLTPRDLAALDAAGRGIAADSTSVPEAVDHLVTGRIIRTDAASEKVATLIKELRLATAGWSRARQRQVS